MLYPGVGIILNLFFLSHDIHFFKTGINYLRRQRNTVKPLATKFLMPCVMCNGCTILWIVDKCHFSFSLFSVVSVLIHLATIRMTLDSCVESLKLKNWIAVNVRKRRKTKLPLSFKYLLGYTISVDVPLSFQIDYCVSSSSEL